MTFAAGFYAQRRSRRLVQLAVDLFVVICAVIWWLVGRTTERTVDAIVTPARSSGAAARDLRDHMREAGEQTGGNPGLGPELLKPFDGAMESLQDVIDAAD